MAWPPLTTIALHRRRFLRTVPGALAVAVIAANTAAIAAAAKSDAPSSTAPLPHDCGFIVDAAQTHVDLGMLPLG